MSIALRPIAQAMAASALSAVKFGAIAGVNTIGLIALAGIVLMSGDYLDGWYGKFAGPGVGCDGRQRGCVMTWHTDLSPAASDAVRRAGARERMYKNSLRCTLARNATRAIIIRPTNRNREHQLAAYDWIKANLPAFEYDPVRGWWTGPLEALPDVWRKMKEFDMVTLSDGARQYLEEMGVLSNGKESNAQS